MAFSAADLLEKLREPGETYESLAARLPISLSTVNRWKKQSPRDWDTCIALLERAGLLNLEDAGPVALSQDHPESVAARYARLLENQIEALTGQEEIRDELRELRKELGLRAQAAHTAPKQSRRVR